MVFKKNKHFFNFWIFRWNCLSLAWSILELDVALGENKSNFRFICRYQLELTQHFCRWYRASERIIFNFTCYSAVLFRDYAYIQWLYFFICTHLEFSKYFILKKILHLINTFLVIHPEFFIKLLCFVYFSSFI